MKTNDILLDWFNTYQLSFADFEKDFFEPMLKQIKEVEYRNQFFIDKPECAHRIYYTVLGLIYAARYASDFTYIDILLKIPFSHQKEQDDSRVVGLILENALCRFEEQHKNIQRIYNWGSLIFEVQHRVITTRYPRTSQYDKWTTVFEPLIRVKQNKSKVQFLAAFKHILQIDFPQKLFFIFKIHYSQYRSYDREVKFEPTPEIDHFIIQKLDEAILEHNQKNEQQIDCELLKNIGKYILLQKYSDDYYHLDYKKQRRLKVKNIETLKDFITIYQGRSIELISHILFCQEQLFALFPQESIEKDFYLQLLKKEKLSCEVVAPLFQHDFAIGNRKLLEYLYTPLFEKIMDQLEVNDGIREKFEALTFAASGTYFTGSPYKKAISLLRETCQVIPDENERELIRLKYSNCNMGGNLDPVLGFWLLKTGNTNNLKSDFKSLIDNVSNYLPIALKQVNSGFAAANYTGYQITINIGNRDVEITEKYMDNLNLLLVEYETGVVLLPLPVYQFEKRESGHNIPDLVCSLSLFNYTQYQWVMKHYLLKKYPHVVSWWKHQEKFFTNKNGIPFYQKVKENQVKVVNSNDINQFAISTDWAWFRKKYIDAFEKKSRETWYDLMNTLLKTKGGKKPNSKWLSIIRGQINKYGSEKYVEELRVLWDKTYQEDAWYFETYRHVLKGIIWTCSDLGTDESLALISQITQRAYAKIRGKGARSTAIGNAGLLALANSNQETAYGLMILLRNRTKYHSFIRAIDKHLTLFKSQSNIPAELLADKSIPNFGLADQKKVIHQGEYSAELSFQKGKLKKTYFKNGHAERGLATIIKQEQPAWERVVNAEFKQLNNVYKNLKERVKTYWQYDREWSATDWKNYVLGHQLIYPYVENMLWIIENRQQTFIVQDHQLKAISGEIITLDSEDRTKLWHPIHVSANEVRAWQDFIFRAKIQQPLRQVYREFYPFSETELSLTETPRFANHFLEVKKLMAIANGTGWMFTYVHQGKNWPRTYIEALDLTVHFYCDYSSYDLAIPSQNLFFTRGDSTKIGWNMQFEKLPLQEIPLVTLSEICRDIDLFISTTSIANNPGLAAQRTELKDYSRTFSERDFSENGSIAIRKRIIEQVAEVIELNDYSFTDRHLKVKGKWQNYQIHLNSGFAQIVDQKAHLNLLPNVTAIKRNRKLKLPFVDDDVLYLILGKALLLQNEELINDPKIIAMLK